MSRGPWLTAAFKAEVWRHWQVGETCSEIGRALYKCSGVIHAVVVQRGGVAPVLRVIVTHLHPDRISLADWLTDGFSALPKRWISVTAPDCPAAWVSPAVLAR